MGISITLRYAAAILGRCLLAVALTAAAPALAGDEVDYSAPYVTVENGELVTRYPAKAHDESGEKEISVAGADGEATPAAPVVLAVALGIGVAMLAWLRIFTRRASRRRDFR